MSTQFRNIVSALLVISMVFSSVGYTTSRYLCPKMKSSSQAPCAKCKNHSSEKDDCCKQKIEHHSVKVDFVKPSLADLRIFHNPFASVFLTVHFPYQPIPHLTSLFNPPPEKLYSEEKYVLFSALLI